MAIAKQLNPWGRSGTGLDIQRQDLWMLDISPLTSAINDVRGSTPYSKYANLYAYSSSETMLWIKSCELPAQGVSEEKFRVDTVIKNYPGKDLVGGDVRLTLYVDTSSAGGSKTIATILAWESLRSTGNYDKDGTIARLATATDKPKYIFDLKLSHLKGYEGASNFTVSQEWTLSKCWLESWQLSDYKMSSRGEYQTCNVTLQCGACWISGALSGSNNAVASSVSVPSSVATSF